MISFNLYVYDCKMIDALLKMSSVFIRNEILMDVWISLNILRIV